MTEAVAETVENPYADLGVTDELVQWYPNTVPLTQEVAERLDNEFYILRWEGLNEVVNEDDDQEDWKSLDKIKEDRIKRMEQARLLMRKSPHVKRANDLYQYYILGDQFRPTLAPVITDYDELTEADEKEHKKIARQGERAWEEFKRINRKAWTANEALTRLFRDGEVFNRELAKKKAGSWSPVIRFLDPEEIGDGQGDDEDGDSNLGIVTDPQDVVEPIEYWRWDEEKGEVIEKIPAEKVWHWKINVDSNEKRGRTQYESVIDYIRQLVSLVHNEVTHRTAQSAIVLVRKVAGKNKPRQLADNAYTSTTQYPEGTMQREKMRAGTILTTNPSVEIEFAQPKGDFSDATPLVNLLIGHLAAATGWTYAQLTTDPGQGNFASSLVNESPVLQMIMYWQNEFAENIDPIYRRIIEAAIEAGEIEYSGDPEEFWTEYETEYGFPRVANINPKDNAQRINLSLVNRSMSRAQAQREQGLDPERMAYEIGKEDEQAISDMAAQMNATGGSTGGTNPTMGNMAGTSKANANAGGANQNSDAKDIQHRDRKGTTP